VETELVLSEEADRETTEAISTMCIGKGKLQDILSEELALWNLRKFRHIRPISVLKLVRTSKRFL